MERAKIEGKPPPAPPRPCKIPDLETVHARHACELRHLYIERIGFQRHVFLNTTAGISKGSQRREADSWHVSGGKVGSTVVTLPGGLTFRKRYGGVRGPSDSDTPRRVNWRFHKYTQTNSVGDDAGSSLYIAYVPSGKRRGKTGAAVDFQLLGYPATAGFDSMAQGSSESELVSMFGNLRNPPAPAPACIISDNASVQPDPSQSLLEIRSTTSGPASFISARPASRTAQ